MVTKANTDKELIEKLAQEIMAAFTANPQTSIALSGGSTPQGLYQYLSQNGGKELWRQGTFIQVDERCVPPDHKESNYRMIKETFLDPADLPPNNFLRMEGERLPQEAAELYTKELAERCSCKDGIPIIDIMLLGIGTDGHTASIFPDSIELMESAQICGTAKHPESGQNRITLTGKVINSAKQICVLASGIQKAETVGRIFKGDKKLPASHIAQKAHWFLDINAAAEL